MCKAVPLLDESEEPSAAVHLRRAIDVLVHRPADDLDLPTDGLHRTGMVASPSRTMIGNAYLKQVGEAGLAIKQAIATLGIDTRRIEELAERMKDRPEGATLFSIAARIRQAAKRLGETPAP